MLKDLTLWILWGPFRRLIRKSPVKLMYALARQAGNMFYLASGARRAAANHALAMIGIGRETKLIRRAFQSHCMNEFEALIYPDLNGANIDRYVECADLWRLDEGLKHGRGVMLLFAHFGANQMIMPAVGYKGYKMSQISAPTTVWDEVLAGRNFSAMKKKSIQLQWESEMSLPVTHISVFGSLKPVFKCLKNNEILGIAIDGGGGKSRVEAPFFGKTIHFFTGAMDIAMRTGCVVIPTFMTRKPDGASRMILEEPLAIETGGDYSHAMARNVQAFTARLEEYVRAYPWLYLTFMSFRKIMEAGGEPAFITGAMTGTKLSPIEKAPAAGSL